MDPVIIHPSEPGTCNHLMILISPGILHLFCQQSLASSCRSSRLVSQEKVAPPGNCFSAVRRTISWSTYQSERKSSDFTECCKEEDGSVTSCIE
jgi:hypothetical protein